MSTKSSYRRHVWPWIERGDQQLNLALTLVTRALEKAPGGSRRFNPVVRRMLGQMEYLRAVGEKRRASFGEIQTACVNLHQQPNQAGSGDAFVSHSSVETRQHIAVG